MNPFLFMPLWACFLVLITPKGNSGKNELPGANKKTSSISLGGAIAAFSPLFILAVWGPLLSDSVGYAWAYLKIDTQKFSLGDYLNTASKEWGFIIFTYLSHWISSGSVTFYRAMIALVQSIPIVYIYRKYSCNYALSLFLFITSATYFSWMMNGLRQFMAVTIILCSFPWLVKKEYFKVIIVILCAALFHKSALIMIPIIFIVHGEAFNGRTMLYIALSLLATWVFAGNDALLEDAMDIGGYGGTLKALREGGDDGINIIRFAVSSVPAILAWFSKEKIKAEDNKIVNIMVNMSVITAGLNLIATVTSGIMIGRLPIYTGIYSYILLPWLITHVFQKQNVGLITFIMMFCYLCYYPFELGAILWR